MPLRVACEVKRVGSEPTKLVGVVIASRGAPESSESGQPIEGVAAAERLSQVTALHAGTARRDGVLVTSRRPGVDSRRPWSQLRRGNCSSIRGRVTDSLRRHAIPTRHRTKSFRPNCQPAIVDRQSQIGDEVPIITFGCRVNQADSLGFEEALRERGAVAAESSEQAELVIINTCSVTASADQGARQAARRLARTNPNAQIVVTGCYATRQPNEFRLLPNVLRVVPNDEKSRLVSARVERSRPHDGVSLR